MLSSQRAAAPVVFDANRWPSYFVSDVFIACALGVPYEDLLKFWATLRPYCNGHPTRYQTRSMLIEFDKYRTEYYTCPVGERYPISKKRIDTTYFFAYRAAGVTSPNMSEAPLQLVLESGGLASPFCEDIYGEQRSTLTIKNYLIAHTTVDSWKVFWIDLHMKSRRNRLSQNQLDVTVLVDLRGLNDRLFQLAEDSDLNFHYWDQMIRFAYADNGLTVSTGRLNSGSACNARLILNVPKESFTHHFAKFKTACAQVETMLMDQGMMSKTGGVYPMYGETPIRNCKLPQSNEKSISQTPNEFSGLMSDSNRERMANMLNPAFDHDAEGDAKVVDAVDNPPQPIVVDITFIFVELILKGTEQNTLKSFEDAVKSCYPTCPIVGFDIVDTDPIGNSITVQIQCSQPSCILIHLAKLTDKIILADGSEYHATTSANKLPSLYKHTTRRKRSICDSSLAETAEFLYAPDPKKFKAMYGDLQG